MSMIYKFLIRCVDPLVPKGMRHVWDHPAGPKTVHFWAPFFKWGLVIAGLGDFNRPVEKVSLNQASSLALTGVIWSRYSMVITPKNWSLFSVNLFVALTSAYQVIRRARYEFEMKEAEKAKEASKTKKK